MPCRSALARFLAQASGAKAVAITALDLMRGGAIQQNWGIEARLEGGALAGEQHLVLRTAGPARFSESLMPEAEFAVLQAAFGAGVRAPEPLFAGTDGAVCGQPFLVMRRAAGGATPARITGGVALPEVAEDLGRQLARLHRIRPPRHDLADLPAYHDPRLQIAALRAALDHRPQPRPVLEWGLRWLETHLPEPVEPVLCHRDFRTGNYLLAVAGAKMALAAILDWEFAGWSDPHEDIGWFCCKAWRFARLDREAGGIAGRQHFYRGYESEADRRIDPQRAHFWEILASVRWAVMALQQSERCTEAGERNLDLALTGRRATESEFEILMLLDPALSARVPLAPDEGRLYDRSAEPREMRDLPSGPGLLALARTMLSEELMPLLPRDRQDDAQLVAAAMAIAERQAAVADDPFAAILRELAAFYGSCAYLPGSGEGGVMLLLRRFAGDLRQGVFEASPERERAARALMKHLTITKLHIENPRFLAANGFL